MGRLALEHSATCAAGEGADVAVNVHGHSARVAAAWERSAGGVVAAQTGPWLHVLAADYVAGDNRWAKRARDDFTRARGEGVVHPWSMQRTGFCD